MNDFNKLLAIGLMLSAGAIISTYSAQSHAQIYNDGRSNIYLGASYGGFKARGGSFDDENDYFEGDLGVRFNSLLGIEASYLYFGEYGNDLATAKLDGYAFSVVGYLPMADTVDIFAKAGMFYSTIEIDVGGFEADSDDDQPFFGLGAAIAISEPLQLTIEYDRYKIDIDDQDFSTPLEDSSTDIDTVKVGLRYVFM